MILPPPLYKVELIAENGKHSYKVIATDEHGTGEYVFPGVTGVLSVISKPAIGPWMVRKALDNVRTVMLDYNGAFLVSPETVDVMIADSKRVPDAIKDDAAKLGTEAHVYIDKVVKGEPLGPLPDAILDPVSAFADWWRDGQYRFVAGDTKVASRRHGFGGSLDALATRGDELFLLDWKTSKALYDEYALQVAAYAYAFGETYGVQVKRAVCVRFRKPGVDGPPFEALEVKDIPASFEAFLAAKHLQEALKQDQFNRPPKQEKPHARKSRKVSRPVA